MKQIPTAKDMVDKWQDIALNNIKSEIQNDYSLENTLIEFAKLHVEAALYVASERADLTDNGRFPYVDKDSILNSYSLDNIK